MFQTEYLQPFSLNETSQGMCIGSPSQHSSNGSLFLVVFTTENLVDLTAILETKPLDVMESIRLVSTIKLCDESDDHF